VKRRYLVVPVVATIALVAVSPPVSLADADSVPRQTVTVIAGRPLEFAFALSVRRVSTGWVTFRVTNAGRIPHDFAIRGRQTPVIGPGQSVELTVRFAVPGVYEYTCTVAGHASAGMTGQLTVTGMT
jgi:uncharacterized cupredoxin-like copper-binding protein